MNFETIAWLALTAWAFLGLMFFKSAYIKWEWKDMWQGIYFGKDATYVCPIPFLVFVFPKEEKINGIPVRQHER